MDVYHTGCWLLYPIIEGALIPAAERTIPAVSAFTEPLLQLFVAHRADAVAVSRELAFIASVHLRINRHRFYLVPESELVSKLFVCL